MSYIDRLAFFKIYHTQWYAKMWRCTHTYIKTIKSCELCTASRPENTKHDKNTNIMHVSGLSIGDKHTTYEKL